MAFHYKVYGEPLSSAIELDVLEPCEPSAPDAGGWSFRVGAEEVPEDVDWYHTIAGADENADEDGALRYGEVRGSHFVAISGYPTVRIATAEREIVALVRGPVSRETLTHVVVDQALPLCIAHSRRLVLHASCVVRGENAIAFAAPSGSGKSTLAAAFCARGWQLVSDDALAFESLTPPRVRLAYRSIRLWGDSLRWMGEAERSLPRVVDGTDKRRLEFPRTGEAGRVDESFPLRRLYLVRPATAGTPHAILRPGASETMMAVAASSFRLDTRDRACLTFEFDALAQLMQTCRPSILEVSRGFDRLASLIDLVEEDLG